MSATAIEAEIRGLGLRSRCPLHHGEADADGPHWAHHRAEVWDPATRARATAWSDHSAAAALTDALAVFRRSAPRSSS